MKAPALRRAFIVAVLLAAVAGLWLRLSPRGAPVPIGPASAATPDGVAPPATRGRSERGDPAAAIAPKAASLLESGRSNTTEIIAALQDHWSPAPRPDAPSARQRPPAPRLRRVSAETVERRFKTMAADVVWTRASAAEIAKQRARLSRLGIGLERAECRVDACRFELLLTGARAETRRRRLGGESRTLASGSSVVQTVFEPSGSVRTIVFLTREGRPYIGRGA